MNHSTLASRLSRRTFLGGLSAAAAGSATASVLPTGGLFSGTGRLRVGVIGCGGRGTGAAAQAAAAAADVSITCLGDLFADQVASSAAMLERAVGSRFDCPAERRFSGVDAWRQVLASDVDLVILAAPPATRPQHLAAAIATGRHVYCEKPAAIDARGLQEVIAACAEARSRGLSIGSGLCLRHDEATRVVIARIHDGAIGQLRRVAVRASIGLPWQRPLQPGWSHAEWRLRNWIACDDVSGGPFVEHHIHAVDKALWAFGDACPAAVAPAAGVDPADALAAGGTAVVYTFADGRIIEASIDRRSGNGSRIEELATGTAGRRSLAGPAGPGEDTFGGTPRSPHAAAMAALVASILSGRRRDETAPLCRSTQAAVLGRLAAETGRTVAWNEPLVGMAGGPRAAQAVQSVAS